ncbi:hypothetical protein F939_02302 [Acinetobacter radioresistens DSM 6976 = NBRC 102413 = CIP 103788]|uniref:hypothetical protein n=1 Tax=Acinetobacter TaxID=469 RepID=UPI00028CE9FC|nr:MULTISPECIES: hypothetical protein [Acinetobacter]ENV87518.1 hypothetical protein F939_02302 [Acinetobacter radioresistens DSM 6976 = NBRC 102413 = CIP 103788]EXE10760.1 hypothetical protein J559_3266 [Acinetobacter sp. 983759]MCM1934597.1 hypothetical protein [Acinetobacter radioresistens]MCM1952116.1 hypothetical protein [Acinetobacter radioresistens]MCU4310364.1 hypothetical protein [Acinetobacter radioresistens]
MNKNILAEIEINQKIYLFQKAVERYAVEKTLPNAQAVSQTKAQLLAFTIGGGK